MNPKVSIVITCYNDHKYVEKAVQSALEQSIENKEVILVDDGSDLKTKKILRSMESKVDKLIIQNNKGVSAARNKGIEESSGNYILILDGDDYFDTKFCEKALEAFQKEENICLVTCHARWFTKNGEDQIYRPQGGSLENYLFRNSAIGNSMFLKADWEAAGRYDEKMLMGWEDWEFFIRLHKNSDYTYVIPELLFHYRKKKISRTSIANQNKYDLLGYILKKHQDLYLERFPETLDYLVNRLKNEHREKKNLLEKIDFKVGNFILNPLRGIKKILIDKNP